MVEETKLLLISKVLFDAYSILGLNLNGIFVEGISKFYFVGVKSYCLKVEHSIKRKCILDTQICLLVLVKEFFMDIFIHTFFLRALSTFYGEESDI